MKIYNIWFRQINATMVTVKASSAEQAKAVATKHWKMLEAIPVIMDIALDDSVPKEQP